MRPKQDRLIRSLLMIAGLALMNLGWVMVMAWKMPGGVMVMFGGFIAFFVLIMEDDPDG